MTRSSVLVTVFVESRSVTTSLRGSTGTDFDPLLGANAAHSVHCPISESRDGTQNVKGVRDLCDSPKTM